MTWIKFCGCRSWEEVALAARSGADAAGLILAPSPRRIAWDAAAEIARRSAQSAIEVVPVMVDPSAEEVARVRALFPRSRVQFSGGEPASMLETLGDAAIKAIHVRAEDDEGSIAVACDAYAGATILFDTHDARRRGGTGVAFTWQRVAPLARQRKVVVAGGLEPGNVAACVRAVRPFGVDVRSGVESADAKDAEKMRAFVRAVRQADET